DDAGRRLNLGVRRVFANEDDVPFSNAVDLPVQRDLGAAGAAGLNELRPSHEIADVRIPADTGGIGQHRDGPTPRYDALELELLEAVFVGQDRTLDREARLLLALEHGSERSERVAVALGLGEGP